MTASLLIAAAVIAALLALNAFFSAAETALTGASRARMATLEREGDHAARRVNKLNEDRERMIGAVLLGANVVTIAASAIASTIFSGLYGDLGPLISTLVLTPLLLIFGEVGPKTYAITAADQIARAISLPVQWMVRVLAPITGAVQWIVNRGLRLIGVRVDENIDVLSQARAEIAGAVELHAEEGGVEAEQRHRLLGALDLSELEVADVMIHRKSIRSMDIDLPPREIIAQAMSSPHTRTPLYQEEPDNIVGVLHARDLLRAISEHGRDAFDVREVMRTPWFTPMTTSAEDQLAEFLRRREHFALVVDEYGALMGLVTLEDILEEIVGDIKDEHDIAVQGVRPQPDGSVNVDGAVPIRDLNRVMNWDLPDEEAVTIAGLVIHEAQAIPEPGQRFAFHGYRFQVLRRQRNQLTALRVEREVEERMEGG
ncbi:MAG TPA: HlyC/CorC family transporter [Vitreimonas sp.]|uniref:HlyC/CorC family transporter n=1 Tax=Vitreimonas sp. TaxID=3069702 RepID=UPI002D273541|nr:HlyC/CorC family transporter [Vitreimonas sp.]HYD87691.1 HlyC/CorC family transporter [Vitreimonas sp.]